VPTATFYPLLESAATVTTKPTDFLGTLWGQKNAAKTGANALLLSTVAGSVQQSNNKSDWSVVLDTASARLGHAQFLTAGLAGQTISAANWTVGFALKLSNAAAGFTWSGRAALILVNGSTGATRTMIADVGLIGAGGSSSTAELTVYSTTFAGASATVTAGDYVALELGISVSNNSGGDITPNSTLYTSGTTTISSDNAATADAKSFVTPPAALTLQNEGSTRGSTLLTLGVGYREAPPDLRYLSRRGRKNRELARRMAA
jgi:hypothetical protein